MRLLNQREDVVLLYTVRGVQHNSNHVTLSTFQHDEVRLYWAFSRSKVTNPSSTVCVSNWVLDFIMRLAHTDNFTVTRVLPEGDFAQRH